MNPTYHPLCSTLPFDLGMAFHHIEQGLLERHKLLEERASAPEGFEGRCFDVTPFVFAQRHIQTYLENPTKFEYSTKHSAFMDVADAHGKWPGRTLASRLHKACVQSSVQGNLTLHLRELIHNLQTLSLDPLAQAHH